ncbi:MAG TPA: phosphoenolpyruvate synthase, partial [Chitinophagaceae bacterium]|nr:phosphoenolpyruvate synthase [Chitinophagaceae bacterium]
SQLQSKGIRVPNGFATTSFAFQSFLRYNALHTPLYQLMQSLDRVNFSNLRTIGAAARSLLLKGTLPIELRRDILQAYHLLQASNACAVAVRSSATAEDLPTASFAGQHESYLNIFGEEALLQAVVRCYASLYTDRAIKYREDNHFVHEKVSLSVGIQQMVRADKGGSGVAFTLDPESGFKNVVHISAVWGLGETLVQGTVTPDEFYVFKPTLQLNKDAIIRKKIGSKAKTMLYGTRPGEATVTIDTPPERQLQPVINDQEIQQLAKWACTIELHYQCPMDIEWAKDGTNGDLYILQARPETVQSGKNLLQITDYSLTEKRTPVVSGQAIGTRIVSGRARLLSSPAEADKLQAGEIIVTEMTSPDWDPMLKKTAAIVTNKGGRTSHAAIVAREMDVPAIVGCNNATEKIADGDLITVSCCEGATGYVYEGKLAYKASVTDFTNIKKPGNVQAMLIVADPAAAFKLSFYPSDGVGLLRLEFIINHTVQVHPMALVKFDELTNEAEKKQIEQLTAQYKDKKQFFIDRLAEGVAMIAAAFYPRQVIVRMSDFKTNEYAHLLGGAAFEPAEENPMIGFRGASRYYHEKYRAGFELECAAMKKLRGPMGLTNIKLMIPFCRTLEEAQKVIAVMKRCGLEQGVDGLELYMMAELPSNVILAEKFAALFDGFSIGSNDLTQLVLGIDRDAATISELFNEENEAVKSAIADVIRRAKASGVPIGLCGQAPSDHPAFAQFLVEQGINSISFNPDAFLKGIENIQKANTKMMATA